MLLKILQILFPSPCLNCGLLGDALCSRCYNYLEFSPHFRDLEDLQVCSAFYYQPESILGNLVHPFKYKHQADIFRIFVPHMREALRLLVLDPRELVLVPVPLHKKRQLDRGYNQAELLAKWVAKGLGCEMQNALVRVKNTSSQASLESRAQREANISDAFRVLHPPPKGSHVVLVDDIVTSGSTLLACMQTLRAAGTWRISALTLADREKTTENLGN